MPVLARWEMRSLELLKPTAVHSTYSCENKQRRRAKIQSFTDANVCSGNPEYSLVEYWRPLQTSGCLSTKFEFSIEVPMEVSRRIFLRHSAVAAAACAALPMQGW